MTLRKISLAPAAFAFRATARIILALNPREYRYVFILSPRRSGSSLLSHILGSHPDFVSAGETYTIYKTPADLPNLVPRTCQLLRKLTLRGKYVVDKITMDQFLKTDEILSSPLIHKCIILIRAPEGSLQSLISQYGIQYRVDEKVALREYVNRLATLARYGAILRQRAILVEYDDLVDRTDDTLNSLTRFLGACPSFTPNYATHKGTGKLGDDSENIFAGRVIRTQPHENRISTEIVSEAAQAFRRYRDELLMSGVQSARLLKFTDGGSCASCSP